MTSTTDTPLPAPLLARLDEMERVMRRPAPVFGQELDHHNRKCAEARTALERELAALVADRERWAEWASHQEWCRNCAEAHPRDCSDGALRWARCHVNDQHAETAEEARKIVDERDPDAARAIPRAEEDTNG